MGNIPRRSAMKLGALGAALTLTPVSFATAQATVPELAENFPPDVPLSKASFLNWDRTISIPQILSAKPLNTNHVRDIANWAKEQKFCLRPMGFKHNWSPLVVESTVDTSKTLLLDMTGIDHMQMLDAGKVRVGSGAAMEVLMNYLHQRGRTISSVPAPGDVSVAGVLAINGHGTGIPALGETPTDGQKWGTLCQRVHEISFIGWDEKSSSYTVQTVNRQDPRAAALYASLGRILLLEVVMDTSPDFMVRCRNYTHIHRKDLFAPPGSAGKNSLSALLDRSGRVGLIWYAFTDHPWVQEWTRTPTKPATSRAVTTPYNYPFADRLPDETANILTKIVSGQDYLAPLFGPAILTGTATGLAFTGALDMWGPNKAFVNFVRPTTLRVSAASHAVITDRASIQGIVHRFTETYATMQAAYAKNRSWPINACVEIRVTTTDDFGTGEENPALSAATPDPKFPNRNIVVWLDVLNLPGTRDTDKFLAELETHLEYFAGDTGTVRPEWSKRWGHTQAGPWTNQAAISKAATSFPRFDWAVKTLEAMDPHGVFKSTFYAKTVKA